MYVIWYQSGHVLYKRGMRVDAGIVIKIEERSIACCMVDPGQT